MLLFQGQWRSKWSRKKLKNKSINEINGTDKINGSNKMKKELFKSFKTNYKQLPSQVRSYFKKYDIWTQITILSDMYPWISDEHYHDTKRLYEQKQSEKEKLSINDNNIYKHKQIYKWINQYNAKYNQSKQQLKKYKYIFYCQSKYQYKSKYDQKNLFNEFHFTPSKSINKYITVDLRGWAPKDYIPDKTEKINVTKCFPKRHFEYLAFVYCPYQILKEKYMHKLISYIMKENAIIEFPVSYMKEQEIQSVFTIKDFILKRIDDKFHGYTVHHHS